VQVELERSAKTPLDQAVSKYIIAGYLVNSVKTIPPGHKDPPAKRHSRPPPRGDCRIVEQIYGYPRPWHPSYTGNLNGAGLSIIWICWASWVIYWAYEKRDWMSEFWHATITFAYLATKRGVIVIVWQTTERAVFEMKSERKMRRATNLMAGV